MEKLFLQYPKCTTCRKAKKFLQENNVTFNDRDITIDNPTVETKDISHMVQFVKGTKFYEIFGEEYKVNSFHHQAIKKTADELTVCGTSSDGIIEAVEIPGELLAVQWHPEKMTQDPLQHKIFTEFIKMCK